MSCGGDAARSLESSRHLYCRAGKRAAPIWRRSRGSAARAHQRRAAACAQMLGGGAHYISSSRPPPPPPSSLMQNRGMGG
eukprot:6950554-Pyramimonas_sp.AAC.1